jgi:hypothetical protein
MAIWRFEGVTVMKRTWVIGAVVVALAVIIFAVAVAFVPADHERLVGTWFYSDHASGPLGYAFSADGTYREYYNWGPREPTQTLTGKWVLGQAEDMRSAVVLKTDQPMGADGVLAYRFSGADLLLDDRVLVRRR